MRNILSVFIREGSEVIKNKKPPKRAGQGLWRRVFQRARTLTLGGRLSLYLGD